MAFTRPHLKITIPNLLTVIRILLTPLFVIFLLREWFSFALLVFVLAGISDGLDGLIARYFNQRSSLGALLDPLADKLLLTAAFISLAVLKAIPGWLTVIVISRDVVILLGIAVFALTNISFEIKPSLISKWTTVAQLSTIGLTLLNPRFSGAFLMQHSLYWITAGLTILSGTHYMYRGLNILQNASGNDHKSTDRCE
ncbi:MAG: CDP-diacylglycerol--glycerol-3-phosphate 3-phosphatidyltransferase [Desulfobacterales bacterium]|nr:MAG: CDP-diacylglycerol--glycerol-3-phosphate 3-phosphatidyltransferase [Desulfobacterales bacterium]